jgi:23S rRNA-/tRNA-specific pseudouridylate synthase
VLVVDKPAGLETLPGRRGGPSLQQLLPAGATPLHRLDAEASGLVLCARSHAAAAVLQPALASGRISREYAAVVRGAPPDSGRIDLRIGARAGGQPMAARRQCYPADATQGQAATTLFQTLGRRRDDAGQPQALLQVELQSGRTHQIRVHLATLGFPIVGDRLYGDGDQAAGRLLLHAQRLRFRHPRTGRPCLAVSPPPPEFGWPTAHATPAAAPPTA